MQRLKWLVLVAVLAAGSMVLAAPAGAIDPSHPPACHDGIDNDRDGLIDYPADGGCTSIDDTDEAGPPPPKGKAKCNSGRGNGSELVNGVDCDPGNSGGKNNGGD